MDWNQLKTDWQEQQREAAELQPARPDARNRLWRVVRSRDGMESMVALVMAPFFLAAAAILFLAELRIAALFAGFLFGVMIYIPWRLWRSRRLIPKPDPERPVREFLLAERSALDAQARMLRSVARWYYGPIAIGTIGLYTSLSGASLSSLLYALLVIAMCVVIEWINRRAAKTQFERSAATLDAQIRQLEEDNDE